jgi:hypothetical protein
MKLFKILGATLATLTLLAGCGGGNSLTGTTCTTNCTTGGSTVASVTVTSSAPSVAADGTTSATITATALDGNNVALANVPITFAATTGGQLSAAQSQTDTSGHATATLTASPGATAGTNVTVSAAAGSVKGTAIVAIVAIQQTLAVTTSSPSIFSDGTQPATITALMRDANNNVLPGITISFVPDSGVATKLATAAGLAATPAVPAGVTDANGIATAQLSAGGDPTNRVINVTVSGGTATPVTIPISVTGTTLTFSGPASIVAGNSATYTAVLTDHSTAGVPNKTVTFTSANGNTLSAPSVTTDALGRASVQLTGTNGGADTVTATSLGLTAVAKVSVSSESFAFTSPTAQQQILLDTIPPTNAPTQVSVTWTSNGAPKVGVPVAFATTRGSFVSLTPPYAVISNPSVSTDANGVAMIGIASSAAGNAIVSASGSGVSAQVPVVFQAVTPAKIALQAAPATVPINGQSTITAVVRDAQNNLVAGATVNFNLTLDPTGGSLSTPTSVTDANGQASTTYTATGTASAANGVQVTASIPNTNLSAVASLSVGGQAVFLSLGTGNKISAPNTAQYEQDWAVQALDSHGGAVSNAQITAKVLPLYYFKGFRVWNTSVWVTVNSIPNCPAPVGNSTCIDPAWYTPANYQIVPNGTQCANEDIGWTGIYVASQDLNNNGIIDPGNVASVTPSTGGVTDGTGSLLLKVTWPQDHSYYVGVRLVVSTIVQGTQSSTSADFLLPGLASDFNSQATAPPGLYSPYGYEASAVLDCSNPK